MLFSSSVFLFVFLPIVLLINNVILKRVRSLQNIFLLLISLFFYAWGEPWFVLVMFASIILNWGLAILIDLFKSSIYVTKSLLVLSLIINLSILFLFKYLMFTLQSVNSIFASNVLVPKIILPIGISFFTFHAISYLMDIYRGKRKAQKNPLLVGLYISFFPQLIAGPIIRYETIADQLINRKETLNDFSDGVCRFIIGLGKKVILANSFAVIADKAFSLPSQELSVSFAWLGAIAYTFQILFDFSGYSDMAIGLGKMFGFHFLENFNYPYVSKSITEFWRRWHISLSSWFRDYVYIPLGGSRVKTKSRLVLNLFIVWILTGIWHGANITFIIWGLLYFVLLTIEKLTGFNDKLINDFLRHFYTMFFVVLGWVVFRSADMAQAFLYIKTMIFINGNIFDDMTMLYLSEYKIMLVIAIFASTPIIKLIPDKIKYSKGLTNFYPIIYIIIFIISVSYIAKGSYNPFIYFNF